MMKAGFNRLIETARFSPLMSKSNVLSCFLRTQKGPSYSGWRGLRTASCLKKTHMGTVLHLRVDESRSLPMAQRWNRTDAVEVRPELLHELLWCGFGRCRLKKFSRQAYRRLSVHKLGSCGMKVLAGGPEPKQQSKKGRLPNRLC